MFDKALLGLPGMRGALAALFASALVQAALIAGQILSLAMCLDNLWGGQPIDGQTLLLGAFSACFVGRHVVVFMQNELLDRFARKQSERLLSQVLTRAFDGRADLARQMGTAATAVAATEGIDEVERYVRTIPPKLVGTFGVSLPLLAVLFTLDWVSGVIALVAFPVVVLFMVMLGKQARERATRRFEESRRLSNRFIDTLRGIETLISLGASGRAGASVREASERARITTVRTLSVATLSSAVLDLVTVFGVAAIAMMLAFRLMDGTMGLSTALASLMIAPEYFAPLRSFASNFHASLDGRNALASILAITENAEANADGIGDCALEMWTDTNTVEARDVGFIHGDGTIALQNVSFSCAGFSKIGIVGASGAGKSTLINLLAGFGQPSEGAFLVNGEEADLRASSWKNQLHYIPQKPYLFSASLFENIRFYAPNATRENVERTIEAVGLTRLANELPQGLDTVIGEGGRGLSGGEAQRIALARTLLDDRKVLLFDEPTAHLDIQTELELKQHMLACMEGRLVFLATHRLHWITDMDFVIVLENGRIAEAGVPDDLLARDGALRRFVDTERKGVVA